MKKKLFSIVALSLFAVPVVAQAASVAGGDLYFYGWQDDKKVYPEIGNNSKYMVRASVKVGSSTYTSGYKSAYAYKSANRVWCLWQDISTDNCNEKIHNAAIG